ncbi:MAG: HAD-IIA family hydrolase [Albidovulum sp.]|nr:HAD-IIA family hydrolase [Albidovulum sp.]MDE0532924.1 HAD-IIA family hydrolase [Albidovulum sp.]
MMRRAVDRNGEDHALFANEGHLMSLTVDEAFSAYEAVRHRLPPASLNRNAIERVSTLADLADKFDVFLLDAFGVLNVGEKAIPGTADRVASLKSRGKRILVVSNAASMQECETLEKFRRLGFSFEKSEIVNSRATMADSLRQEKGLHWGVMATPNTRFGDLDNQSLTLLGDRQCDFDSVDGFMLVESGTWTIHRQSMLEDSLLCNPRPVLVANPDIVAPRENGFSAEPGHFAHRLADRTGISPMFFGKPFRNIFERAFERLGPDISKSKVVMVGDSLHTDVLGAQSVGIASALVAGFGVLEGWDAGEAALRVGITPDFLVDRP